MSNEQYKYAEFTMSVVKLLAHLSFSCAYPWSDGDADLRNGWLIVYCIHCTF